MVSGNRHRVSVGKLPLLSHRHLSQGQCKTDMGQHAWEPRSHPAVTRRCLRGCGFLGAPSWGGEKRGGSWQQLCPQAGTPGGATGPPRGLRAGCAGTDPPWGVAVVRWTCLALTAEITASKR